MAGNTVKEMTMNFGKLDKFERNEFRRWQKKMHFFFTTLKVVYVLTTQMLELLKDAIVEAIRIRAKWKNDDYYAGELWDSLESKSMAEDSSSKKFLDFKHTLKHDKDYLPLVQLGIHLRIEESLRAQDSDKGKGKEVGGPSVNMTQEGGKNKHHKQNKSKNDPIRTTVVLVSTRNQSWNVRSVVRLVTSKRIVKVVKRTTQMLVVRERGLRTNPKTKVDVKIIVGLRHTYRWKTDMYFTWVYESDKYILSKSGVFVGFGYYNNGMFILNLNKVPDDLDSVYMSSSTVVNPHYGMLV
nr:hypothetical protein [Tanacetum cinerariifolium]